MNPAEANLEQYDKDLERLALHVKGRFRLILDVPQLESAGRAALLEVMHSGRFNLTRSRGTKTPERAFWAFARQRVFGAMIEENTRHSEYSRERGRKQAAVVKAHSAACVSARTSEDLNARERFREAMGVIEATRIGFTLEERAVRFDALEEPSPTPEQALIEADFQKRLHAAIARLPEQQRVMLLLHYFDGLSLKEVGEKFGVKEQRACQVISAARQALRLELDPGTQSRRRPAQHRATTSEPSNA